MEEEAIQIVSVESPIPEVDQVLALPIYEDQEHEHEIQEVCDEAQSSAICDSSDELKKKIVKQVEYYFGDQNLLTDKFLLGLIKKHRDGFVPITTIASFRKMKKLSQDFPFIVSALRESPLLVVSSDSKKLKRLHPLPVTEARHPKVCTVVVDNLPEDHSVQNIQRIFGAVGDIKNVTVHDANVSEDPKTLVTQKLHALVEYKTTEAAAKAVATLNNEQDWRNGMRVKFLNTMTKNNHKKQAWRGFGSEKNGSSRTNNRRGDEENHNLIEHHKPSDEEVEEQSAKEKKSEHIARPRRKNYTVHGGQGTTHTGHAPPPGPKMPDGTRGFAMGRGRPL